MGMGQKGRLEPGCDADITIFDAERIRDGATYSQLQGPEGIDRVLIGGKTAVLNGQIINSRLGRFLAYKSTK